MTPPTVHTTTVIAVALAMVLAGCGGGSTPDSPTPTGTDRASTTTAASSTLHPTKGTTTATSARTATTMRAPSTTADETTTHRPTNETETVDIPVRGSGTLPFDVNRTYRRTMELLGNPSGVSPPSQIYLYRPVTSWKPTVQDPFAQALLDARRESNFTRERHEGVVFGLIGNESPDVLRFTLVHEFVHNAQFERVDETPGMRAAFAGEHQRRRVGAAIVEGSASYVAFQYMLRYTDRNRTWLRTATDEYRNASPAGKYVWAPYHFGREYVAERVDAPRDHWRLYRNPPNTTEAIILGLAPGAEPPAPLSVSVETDHYEETARETRGEMFARIVLAAELPEERAASGASGWGNDRLVTLQRNDRRGFVWSTRWDSAADAAEFLETFRTAMDRRGERRAGYWLGDGTAIRVVRVAPETVVVATGPPAFVTGIRVTGTNATVTVSPD
jgi:hypothetical protein